VRVSLYATMAKGIQISGEKFAALRKTSLRSEESFAGAIKMSRGSVQRLARKGVHGIHADNFRKIAEGLGYSTDELLREIGVKGDEEIAVMLLVSPALHEALERASDHLNTHVAAAAVTLLEDMLLPKSPKSRGSQTSAKFEIGNVSLHAGEPVSKVTKKRR
jgi:transcriptional regulator with XRE-family HTH domain